MTTFLAESVIGSPKGSAVVTDGAGAGLADAAGAGLADGAGAGLAAGAGAGLVEADGVGEGEGACASAAPIPSQIAAAAIGAAKARRGRRGRFIRISPRALSDSDRRDLSRLAPTLTRSPRVRPLTDQSSDLRAGHLATIGHIRQAEVRAFHERARQSR